MVLLVAKQKYNPSLVERAWIYIVDPNFYLRPAVFVIVFLNKSNHVDFMVYKSADKGTLLMRYKIN